MGDYRATVPSRLGPIPPLVVGAGLVAKGCGVKSGGFAWCSAPAGTHNATELCNHMTVTLATDLVCTADEAWRLVQTIELLRYVLAPWVEFSFPAGDEPERFSAGQCFELRMTIFKVPMGVHRITLLEIDHRKRLIQTEESSSLVRQWRHRIRIEPRPHGCRYEDRIEVDAGVLTPGVWLFAQGLFRHRQRKWRHIAQRLARGEAPFAS